MKFKAYTIFLIVFFLLGFSQPVKSQQAANPYSDWSSGLKISKNRLTVGLLPDERQQMENIWNEIGGELKSEQNAITGTYVNSGYENGYFLRWSSNKGFILIPYFDEDLITDFSYGKVINLGNQEIEFVPERDLNGGNLFKKIPLKWLGIGKSLIPIEKLNEYGLYQAGLGKYNDFNGDCCGFLPPAVNNKFEGDSSLLSIPKKYRQFIKNPIRGRITSIGRKKIVKTWFHNGQLYSGSFDKTALIPVKLNIGRKSGVKKTMLFNVLDGLEWERIQYLEITKVSEKTSQGFIVRQFSYEGKEVYRDIGNDKDKPYPPVKIGTRISTKN